MPSVLRRGRKSGVLRRHRKNDASTDLLLAIGVGLALGAGVALVARERARRRRPMARLERFARRGVKEARRLRDQGTKWAVEHGEALRDGVPVSEIGEHRYKPGKITETLFSDFMALVKPKERVAAE